MWFCCEKRNGKIILKIFTSTCIIFMETLFYDSNIHKFQLRKVIYFLFVKGNHFVV